MYKFFTLYLNYLNSELYRFTYAHYFFLIILRDTKNVYIISESEHFSKATLKLLHVSGKSICIKSEKKKRITREIRRNYSTGYCMHA